MAKKTTTSRKTTGKKKAAAAKKTSSKRPVKRSARGPSAAKKKTTKSSKKTAARNVRKKVTKKKVAKKKVTKRPLKKVAKKTVKKATAAKKKAATKKVTRKKTAKVTTARAASKKKPTAAGSKSRSAGKATKPTSGKAKPATPAKKDDKAANKPTARKGITIVTPKPKPRYRQQRKKKVLIFPPVGEQLLRPGGPVRKPLIPSGPSAAPATADPNDANAPEKTKKIKTTFTKREINKYKKILLEKRGELVGDVSTMETEALMGQSGSLSHLPQHMAEQGSEAYEQTLSLNLAALDRKLIKEIDDALVRIKDGTYGMCELTGQPINPERLVELPWARYSIDAARELERRSENR